MDNGQRLYFAAQNLSDKNNSVYNAKELNNYAHK